MFSTLQIKTKAGRLKKQEFFMKKIYLLLCILISLSLLKINGSATALETTAATATASTKEIINQAEAAPTATNAAQIIESAGQAVELNQQAAEAAKKQTEEIKTEVQQHKDDNEKLKQEIETYKKTISDLQQNLATCSEKRGELEKLTTSQDFEIKQLKSTIEKGKDEFRSEVTEEVSAKYDKQISDLNAAAAEKGSAYSKAKNDLENALKLKQTEIDGINTQIKNLQNAITSLTAIPK